MSGTLISNNITIKFSGTQVAATATATNANMYTVPAGKTLVGSYNISTGTNGATLLIGGTVIATLANNAEHITGALYANAGSVISCTIVNTSTVSFHGVLMENTP
jgi:hypothetical protein